MSILQELEQAKAALYKADPRDYHNLAYLVSVVTDIENELEIMEVV